MLVGKELGTGGEGSVYELLDRPAQVAKLYNPQHQPDGAKQAKLAFMADTADPQLIQHVAWPQATVRSGSKGGPVVGFLMPKVAGRHPVHTIYSPAHRRQERPKATWEFLLCVARNVAAAFEVIHGHGHVVGDVNQGNLLVGDDSRVVLIDSDSFQIDARGTLYLCEVGVTHFVPPELQGIPSFAGVRRTANHDNFGLAILIFHLLFGGRHPFSGVPLAPGVGDALESDIKAFRYAYAKDARKRGIAPPPRSIPITLVPADMQSMFELAFTQRGTSGTRPTAQQWVTALDALREQLITCTVSSVHVYPRALKQCPWCTLEHAGVVYFVHLGTVVTRADSGFELTRIWALIETVPTPEAVDVPQPEVFTVTPRPVTFLVRHMRIRTAVRFVVIAVASALALTYPVLWPWSVLAGLAGFAWASRIGLGERRAEQAARLAAKEQAETAYQQLIATLQAEGGPGRFLAKKEELKRLRDQYLSLPQQEKAELARLEATARERQLQKFLEGFFIDAATIPGIGAARKAALLSFGIETAADVEKEHIEQVHGFGAALTRAMMDWRATCARGFRFNANQAASDANTSAVRARFGARKLFLESALRSGLDELWKLRGQASSRVAELLPRATEAARHLAQTRSDYAHIQ